MKTCRKSYLLMPSLACMIHGDALHICVCFDIPFTHYVDITLMINNDNKTGNFLSNIRPRRGNGFNPGGNSSLRNKGQESWVVG